MRLISYGTFTRPRVYQDLLVTCCTFKSWYPNVLILNIFLTNAEEDNIRSHSKTLGTCIGYEPLIWYGRGSWHSSIGNIALTIWNSHRERCSLAIIDRLVDCIETSRGSDGRKKSRTKWTKALVTWLIVDVGMVRCALCFPDIMVQGFAQQKKTWEIMGNHGNGAHNHVDVEITVERQEGWATSRFEVGRGRDPGWGNGTTEQRSRQGWVSPWLLQVAVVQPDSVWTWVLTWGFEDGKWWQSWY